jgi:hypothetical protein
MPLTVFFLFRKNSMLLFGSGSLHFLYWSNLPFLNTKEPLSLSYFASQLRRHLRAAEYF